jgi:small subunit ribosomal protein S1
MSWTRRVQHPSEVMKKGDKCEVKILKIDHENRRISLGYKQLTEDPWPDIAKRLYVGAESLGTIQKVLDRGVVVDLGDNVEGFVPATQLAGKELTDPTGVFKEGEQIPLQVIEFDQGQHKVVLSAVAYFKKRERAEFESYLAAHPADGHKAMAEAMPEKMAAQAEVATEDSAAAPDEAAETPAEAQSDASPEEAVSEEPAPTEPQAADEAEEPAAPDDTEEKKEE